MTPLSKKLKKRKGRITANFLEHFLPTTTRGPYKAKVKAGEQATGTVEEKVRHDPNPNITNTHLTYYDQHNYIYPFNTTRIIVITFRRERRQKCQRWKLERSSSAFFCIVINTTTANKHVHGTHVITMWLRVGGRWCGDLRGNHQLSLRWLGLGL